MSYDPNQPAPEESDPTTETAGDGATVNTVPDDDPFTGDPAGRSQEDDRHDQPFDGSKYPPPPSSGPRPTNPGVPPTAPRQLVRDPYTRLGGVASGLSHHTGIDVSLIRLAFVLFTFVSGVGLATYLLAWLIVPRATYWPPAGARKPIRSLSPRELGGGLLLLGAMVALFIDGGTFSQVLIPLALVVGGIWLLIQPSADEVPVGPAPQTPPATGPTPAVDTPYPTATPYPDPVGAPVPPRSRGRRAAAIGCLVFIIGIPLALIAAVAAVIAFGDIDINTDDPITYRPATVEAIPQTVDHDAGEVVINLTELDSSMFDETVPLDVELNFGEITVIVPEDLVVDVDASASVGDVTVFDRNEDGFNPRIEDQMSDADISLELDVWAGQVRVERAG